MRCDSQQQAAVIRAAATLLTVAAAADDRDHFHELITLGHTLTGELSTDQIADLLAVLAGHCAAALHPVATAAGGDDLLRILCTRLSATAIALDDNGDEFGTATG
ncbi:hypothetical protein [Gordonia hankookensis]|uniref:Uncharacterized protein n=1 Tax=Gordonia hankookensis TaxID=589403 RepID=A0ABR7W9L2_9ACTN|nr:hypothetical protein [Gordonia hankookensis]MBD1318522.1 hypothetical protein [Gordonia hankookensis]